MTTPTPLTGDYLYIDVDLGVNVAAQPGDWLQVDVNLAQGGGYVLYPWAEKSDGSTSPTPRY